MSFETLSYVVSVLTVISDLVVKLVGIPDQIWQNFKRKSTEGVSFSYQLTGFIAYVLWTLHGLLIHDMTLVIGQFLGVVTTGIILFQYSLYGRKPSNIKQIN
jgi:uncharacterized protein with PQ loop repeat